MERIYILDELDCANCAMKIERHVGKIKGVKECSVDFVSKRMFVDMEHEGIEAVLEETVQAIEPYVILRRKDDKKAASAGKQGASGKAGHSKAEEHYSAQEDCGCKKAHHHDHADCACAHTDGHDHHDACNGSHAHENDGHHHHEGCGCGHDHAVHDAENGLGAYLGGTQNEEFDDKQSGGLIQSQKEDKKAGEGKKLLRPFWRNF